MLDVLGRAPLEALGTDPAELARLRDDCWQLVEEAGRGRLDVVRLAERFQRDQPELRLRAIENCLTERVFAATGAAGQPPEMRRSAHLPTAGLDINIPAALRCLDEVRQLRRQWSSALNKTLAFEVLLWRLGGLSGLVPTGTPALTWPRPG